MKQVSKHTTLNYETDTQTAELVQRESFPCVKE